MSDAKDVRRLRRAVALLRITLGVILLVTWWDNFTKEPVSLYSGEGLTGFLGWLFTPAESGGNGSTLTLYKSILDVTVLQFPAAFAAFQMITEFVVGLGLVVGGLTRLAGLGATFFFLNLFLSYFGGNEWIWTYVLLTISSLVVTLTFAGRELGFDKYLLKKRGAPRFSFLW